LNLPELDFEVRQLEISHDELYLAIAGEKEVAVCVLPGEGFLKRDAARPVVPQYVASSTWPADSADEKIAFIVLERDTII
jgi:hypothetical protein